MSPYQKVAIEELLKCSQLRLDLNIIAILISTKGFKREGSRIFSSSRDPSQTSPFCRPDPNLPFFVDPTQTSCLSTPPKPPLFSRPDPNLSCLTTRPKPSLFVDPNQPFFDPLSYYWIIDICLPQQSLKFVSRVRLIPVILVITERDGVSCLVKKSKMESTWVTDFFLLKSICIYLFILDAAGSCYIRVSQKCFRAVIRRWHVTTHLLYMCVMRQYVGSVT